MKLKNISGLLILTTALFLSGCGSSGGGGGAAGGGSGTPTDTSIDFNLFPPNYFTSYDVSADVAGSDNNGDTYTGTTADKTLPQEIFLGDTAIPVETNINFTVSNGGFANVTLREYFSTDANDRRFLGEAESGTGTEAATTASADTTAIPVTAKIGDSGEIGVYTTNASDVITTTWSLQDGFNGNAKLIITSEERDSGGVLDNTFTTTYLIETDGTRITVDYVTFNINVDLEVTLSGSY